MVSQGELARLDAIRQAERTAQMMRSNLQQERSSAYHRSIDNKRDQGSKNAANKAADNTEARINALENQIKVAKANSAISVQQINTAAQQATVDSATQKRQRQSRTRATSAMQAQGNQQIRDSQSAELQRLGGSGELTSNNQGPTKVSETLGTGSRVTAKQAKGTAPLNQPWESQYVYNPKPKGTAPQDPVKNWEQVATPGVGMFSGVQQKPSTAKPLAKGENAKNRISPYLIPVENEV